MINFNDAFDMGMKNLKHGIHAEVQEKAMEKVARVTQVTIRREMRMAGVKRSSETGTALGRSVKEQQKVASQGSILDLDHKVEEYDERDIAFAGHALHKGAYRARFQGDGTSVHYLWDSTKTRSLSNSPNLTGKNYLENAAKFIKAESKSIVSNAIKSAIRKIKVIKAKEKK